MELDTRKKVIIGGFIVIVIAIFGAYIGALISVLFFSAIATICGVKPDFEEERK